MDRAPRHWGTATGRILDTVAPFIGTDKLATVLVEFALDQDQERVA